MRHTKNLILLLLATITISGCRGAKEVIREVPVEVPVIKVVQHFDTIIKSHERVVNVKGDSVFVSNNDTIIRIKKVNIHDTVPTIIRETLPPEIKEVEKPLTWMQQTMMRVGLISLIVLILISSYKFIRWRLKRNK
jgi:hypothetical protein